MYKLKPKLKKSLDYFVPFGKRRRVVNTNWKFGGKSCCSRWCDDLTRSYGGGCNCWYGAFWGSGCGGSAGAVTSESSVPPPLLRNDFIALEWKYESHARGTGAVGMRYRREVEVTRMEARGEVGGDGNGVSWTCCVGLVLKSG